MASGFTLDRHRDAGTQPGKPPAGRVVAILAWMPLKKSKKIPGVPVENIVDFFLLIGTSQQRSMRHKGCVPVVCDLFLS